MEFMIRVFISRRRFIGNFIYLMDYDIFLEKYWFIDIVMEEFRIYNNVIT